MNFSTPCRSGQFHRSAEGWRELQIGVQDGTLAPGLSEPAQLAALAHRLGDTASGDIVETCPALPGIVQTIASKIGAHGGAALIIDYGDWRALGDTFQALQNHETADPFRAPGTADLTAHVDFEVIATSVTDAKSNAAHTRLTPQGVFLERLGITQRAQKLAAALSGDALSAHIAAHRRLTHPSEMGSLFKVIGIYPQTAQPPAGLEA